MTRRRRVLCSLVAAAVIVAALPVAAMAQTETDRPTRDTEVTDEQRTDRLDAAKARVVAQIERRLTALDRLSSRIDKAKHITENHAASLNADIRAAREVLQDGVSAVDAVETVEELRRVAPPIFETTLVFALLGPKTHAVIGSDAVVGTAARFDEAELKMQDALDALAAAGIDIAEAQADLDEMARLVADAEATGGPVARLVVELQPADWPDPAKSTLADAKGALKSARNELRQARELARSVTRFIRSNSDSASDG